MIGKTLLQYHILEKIGEGGMGIVYKARDNRLNRDVAIKFLPQATANVEEDRQRFILEAQAAAALNHPNITTIHAIEQSDETLFIVMEYIEGQELKSFIPRPDDAESPDQGLKRLSLTDFSRIAAQIAEGLGVAHQQGIIHRDIKSANIMLQKNQRVKIMDFGLAKIEGSLSITEKNSTMGTLAFMSPEQLKGETLTPKTDIWSLGVVMYEMISGHLPFDEEYPQAAMYAILNEPPAPLSSFRPDIPSAINDLIMDCLQKDPANRPADLAAILAVLKASPGDPEAVEQSDPVVPPKANISKRKTLQRVITGVGLAGLLLLSFWLISLLQPDIPEKKDILVLPFNNLSEHPADQTYCDGLMEVISSKLSEMEQFQKAFWVVPPSEVRRLKITSAAEARDHFGVNLVINGSLQKFSKTRQLTITLIDANTLRQVNSRVIDAGLLSADFQDIVIGSLASLLNIDIPEQNFRVLKAGHTETPVAYLFYVKGKGFLQHYNELENINNAIDMFQQALARDEHYGRAYAGLGEAYWRKFVSTRDAGWIEEAIRNCQQALSLSELLVGAHVSLGMIYRGTGEYDAAEKSLRRALELDPLNSLAYKELAGVYTRQGKNETVESTYLKAIELKPNYWANYYDLARFYYKRGKYQLAADNYLNVTKLSPLNYRAYRNLGGCYLILEKYDAAVDALARSIEIKENYGAYANLGALHFIREDYRAAAEKYVKALSFNDRNYQIWGNLASCYDWLKEDPEKTGNTFRKALEMAESALQVNPKDANILTDIASYHASLGEMDKANETIGKALALMPDEIEIQFKAAEVYALSGNLDRSWRYIEKVLAKGYSRQKIIRSPALQLRLSEDPRFQALVNSQ